MEPPEKPGRFNRQSEGTQYHVTNPRYAGCADSIREQAW
jgi:hypothetical protein